MKFKVGDIVVGNQFANDKYNVTTEGWQGKVTQVNANIFRATCLLDDTEGSSGFGLNYDCFDLLKSTEEVNNYEIF